MTSRAFGRARGLFEASHPFPIAAVLALTALVGLASTGGAPDASRFGLMLVAMLCSQLTIGWSNDYLDRGADAVYQPSKPLPSGRVSARLLLFATALALVSAVAAGSPLGGAPLVLLAAGTAGGLAYNLGLKATPLSWLPYVVALALLPPFVWKALDAFDSAFLWLYAFGLPLVIAAHVANTLPDLESDAVGGRGGITVVLGRGAALRLLAACLAAPPLAVLLTTAWLRYDDALLAGVLAVYALAVVLAALAYRGRRGRVSDVIAFRCVVAAAVVLAAGWLAALEA